MTTKISALPNLAAVTDATIIPVVEGGATKKITGVTLKTYAAGAQGTTGAGGAQGSSGTQGTTGSQGTTGTGTQGATGSQGTSGSTGTQGATGAAASNPAAISDQSNTSTGYLAISKGTTDQRPGSPDYGAMRYNTTTGFAEVYTSGGWTVMGSPPPTITSVSPATYNGESGTLFTITGTNFTSDATVKFVDVNNTEYTAAVVTLINSTQLTATTPQDFTVAQEPLDVRVIQLSGTVTRLDCIDTGGSPGWTTTAGQIGGSIYRNGSVNTSVAATDPDVGATIAYSVVSGALPTGLSLNTSTGAITGTAPNVGSDTTYNFTLRATDNAGNTADRAFSMVVLQGSPGAPTIGTATATGSTSATVTFTAPGNTGGSSITSYTAISSPGGITGTLSQSGSGTITVSGLSGGTSYTFTVYATNSYGNSSSSSASNSITTPQAAPSSVEYLVLAGGGSGGSNGNSNGCGGGGGAGGYRTSTLSVAASTGYTVTVGGGGASRGAIPTAQGNPGSNSVFASITSIGGGGGGGDGGGNGGSGGGAGSYGFNPGQGTSEQGNNGGNGGWFPAYAGGGGGGASGAGGNASEYSNGAGGNGSASSITGTSTYYAGGGSSGAEGGYATQPGGAGGGGNGVNNSGTAGNGGNNLGGGGGGSAGPSASAGGSGGSGVVIIAYPSSNAPLASISGGLSYDQPSRSGYRVYRFTGGTGNISW